MRWVVLALAVVATACTDSASLAAMPPEARRPIVENIVTEVWTEAGATPDQIRWALRVIACETGRTWDPTVTSQWTKEKGKYQGLFQVNRHYVHTWPLPEHADDLLDARENAWAGWIIFAKQGRGAWPVCARR